MFTDNKPRQTKALCDTVKPPRGVTDERIIGQEKTKNKKKQKKGEAWNKNPRWYPRTKIILTIFVESMFNFLLNLSEWNQIIFAKQTYY